MSDYSKLASSIVEAVGGSENITALTHCVTRLRFNVKDKSKIKAEEIKNMDGVINALDNAGQFQVVIGPAVTDVYNEAVKLVDASKIQTGMADADAKDTPKEKKGIKGILKDGLDTLIACFVPAIPLISGSGMVKVLAVLLNTFGVLDASGPTYGLLFNVIGDGVIYFLPAFVAYNAAKKMKVDPFLSVGMALIMLHPNFLKLAGDTGATAVSFIGLPVQLLDYSTQAIPAILGVWLLKYVDKFADKVSPNMVKLFLRPMIDLLIVLPVMFIVIGPLSMVLGNAFLAFCTMMNDWGPIAVGLNAVLFPIMVLTGTHNATTPLLVGMLAAQGFDSVFLVSGMAANIAEGGAAFGVALRTKNKKLKATGFSSALSAVLGITEPALYGVNLRMKRPFLSMLAGACIGGILMGLVRLTAPTFVAPSLITLPVFLNRCPNVLFGILSVPATFIITAAIAYFVGFKDLPEDK